MNPSMYLSCCDPQQYSSPENFRALLALHALMIQRPIIQDNFFISGRFHKLDASDSLIHDLIKKDIIGVAFRDSIEPMFTSLKNHLLPKVKAGSYIPFPGDDLSTYEKTKFRSYVGRLDDALADRPTIPWNPATLGRLYRAKMRSSAENDKFGLTCEEKREVYLAVEGLNAQSHSCSLYWQAADQVFTDEDRRHRVQQWARAYYLTNLSDKAAIANSISTELLTPVIQRPKVDVVAMIGRSPISTPQMPEVDPEYLNMVNSGLLNPIFLANVSAKSIDHLRSHPAFSKFQKALQTGRKKDAQAHLNDYVSNIWKEAPEHVPGYREKIISLRRHITAKAYVCDAANLISSAIAFISPQPPLTRAAGGLLTILSQHLDKKRGSEAILERTLEESRNVLSMENSRYQESVFSLIDLVHGAPLLDEGFTPD